MRRVLFVCTGNLCRSPMAEYILQRELSDRGADDVLVESAGTFAMEGNPAARKAVKEMEKQGIDMSGHRARALTRRMLEEADVVVVMEKQHELTALALMPDAGEKIVLMGKLVDGRDNHEIPDPYGSDEEFFSQTCDLIKKAAAALADRLVSE